MFKIYMQMGCSAKMLLIDLYLNNHVVSCPADSLLLGPA